MSRRTIGGRVAAALVAGLTAFALIAPATATPAPKNIIVFIGDGMGPRQVDIGRAVKGAPGQRETRSSR